MLRRLKKFLIGTPLETASLHEQRLPKKSALAILASDNLSSTAYATEEILLALAGGKAGTATVAAVMLIPLFYTIPIGIAIALLTVTVVISYGQTLYAYPQGGGAYAVAKENLGIFPALIAGSSLLIDYSLTVAVSVAAGIAALTSAFPAFLPHRLALSLGAVLIILLANLRGVRESAAVFAGPTYLFILSAYALVIGGLVKYFFWSTEAVSSTAEAASAAATSAPEPDLIWTLALVWLVLKAFASGCAALTGIEAVATGVQVFEEPVARNASITLYILAAMLGSLFIGITVLAFFYNTSVLETETVISQLGRTIFGTGAVYYTIQGSTMLILVLAANTSFTGFPRLASVMASDKFLPRQLANMGDRLVFSNGIVVLSAVASMMLIIFDADVHKLIPLYMVGVFTAFTLSQIGMVIYWRRNKGPGWVRAAIINAIGGTATGIVLIIVAFVKFTHGAWVILFAIPLMVLLCWRIRRHYFTVGRDLSLADYEKPGELKHTAVVPVAGMNRMVLSAIEYAQSISRDVIAVTVNLGGDEQKEMEERWEDWVPGVPLVVLKSPYRAIHRPLLNFIDEVEDWRDDDVVTVVIPEFVPSRWWHQLMHNQTTLFIKAALLFKPNIVVTSVPHHLRK